MNFQMVLFSLKKNDTPQMIHGDVFLKNFYIDSVVSHTVIIHNNYIIGTPAKEYRFKEMMLYNENIDSYYQNLYEKYIWFNTTNIKSSSIDVYFNMIIRELV